MSGILRTTRLTCQSPVAKEKIIQALGQVASRVMLEEDDLEQYLVTVPIEESLEAEIYLIEEFTSQLAHDTYRASQSVQNFESLIRDDEFLLKAPEIHSNPIATKTTSRPPLPLSANPAILLVGMEYKPGTSMNAIAGWKDMAEGAVQSVAGVNVFTVVEDAETNSVRTVEVLDSWETLNILVKTDAAKRNIEHNGRDRTGVKSAIKVRAVAGFVGR